MKKTLMPVLALLVLFVVTPVMAGPIGPQKAEKNPNIIIPPDGGVVLHLPSGVQNGWGDTERGTVRTIILDASKVERPSENKWFYLSHDFGVWLLISMGYPEELAETMWPEGIYIKLVNVACNRPNPKIALVTGYMAFEGCVDTQLCIYVVNATVKNVGAEGWVTVRAEISSPGMYEMQTQRIYLARGESQSLQFEFYIFTSPYTHPDICKIDSYRVWAEAY